MFMHKSYFFFAPRCGVVALRQRRSHQNIKGKNIFCDNRKRKKNGEWEGNMFFNTHISFSSFVSHDVLIGRCFVRSCCFYFDRTFKLSIALRRTMKKLCSNVNCEFVNIRWATRCYTTTAHSTNQTQTHEWGDSYRRQQNATHNPNKVYDDIECYWNVWPTPKLCTCKRVSGYGMCSWPRNWCVCVCVCDCELVCVCVDLSRIIAYKMYENVVCETFQIPQQFTSGKSISSILCTKWSKSKEEEKNIIGITFISIFSFLFAFVLFHSFLVNESSRESLSHMPYRRAREREQEVDWVSATHTHFTIRCCVSKTLERRAFVIIFLWHHTMRIPMYFSEMCTLPCSHPISIYVVQSSGRTLYGVRKAEERGGLFALIFPLFSCLRCAVLYLLLYGRMDDIVYK